MGIERLKTGAILGASIATHAAIAGPVVIDGVTFIDRNASAEIVLGNIRGGLASFDFDNDGWQDLIVSDLFNVPNRLFRNVPDVSRPGERTFQDVTTGSGLDDAEGVSRRGGGVIAADIDNDGFTDLFFVGIESGNASHGLLYRNHGDGTFTNITAGSGTRISGYNVQSISWTDFDLDGFVDLCIGAKIAPGFNSEVVLLRNDGDLTFTDVTGISPTINGVNQLYSHLWVDYDLDGYDDCFLLTLGRAPVVLHNVDDGFGARVFEDTGPTIGFTTLGPAPMGIASADFDNDLDFDVVLTNGATGIYYENVAGAMVQRTLPTSIWGWGVFALDADNDGDLDMYQAGSFGQGANADKLFRNEGGWVFTDISGTLNGQSLVSQFSIRTDFGNDGLQDIVTINPGTPGESISVYENASTTGNHWLTVQLRGDGRCANTDAIGAVVRLTAGAQTQIREVQSGTSTTSTNDMRLHFGLGAAAQADSIEVLWPRAGTLAQRTQVFPGPWPADQIVVLSAPSLEGDVNLDESVSIDDVAFVIFRLGATGDACTVDGDANLDGVVDVDDIAYVIFRLGT